MIIFKQQQNNKKYKEENLTFLGKHHPEIYYSHSDNGLCRPLSYAHITSVCIAWYDPVSPCPQGPSFPEPGWNCPQQGGARGPSTWGFGPGQRQSWPQSQVGAISRQTQRGHFSFPHVQSVFWTGCFSGLWDSIQLEKIIWGFPRKSNLKTAYWSFIFVQNNHELWKPLAGSWGGTAGFCRERKSVGKI